jgi:hypothetical protein
MKKPFCIVVGVLLFSLPSIAPATDPPMYQCPGPSGTILYTNREQADCAPMTLAPLTIAPARTYSDFANSPDYSSHRPFPTDWYDYTAPIGSMRNRLMRGRLYGAQNWIDYNAPVGSMRNSVETWPGPFGWYRW